MLTRLQSKTSWKDTKLRIVDSVMLACGVTISGMSQQIIYVRNTVGARRPFPHLRRNQMRKLVRLMSRWMEERSQAQAQAA